MNADIRTIWAMFRLVFILTMVAGLLSFLAVTFLVEGLTATRGAQQLSDYGVVAKATDVRIHVSRGTPVANSGTSVTRYSVDDVEVVFVDPQGQPRSENLSSYFVQGATPKAVGWTTAFEGHDSYVGKEVLYLPDQPGEAQMREQMQSTLDHGFEQVPTYIGIGLSFLAMLGWAATARVAIGKLEPWMAERRRRLPGMA